MADSRTIKLPALLHLFRWLERFSPPKVLLTLVADAQPKTPIIFPVTKDAGKDGSSERANYRANVVRVVRRIRRAPLAK